MRTIKNHSGYLHVLAIIIPYFIIAGIFQLVASLIAGIDPFADVAVQTTNQKIIITLFTFLGSLVTVWSFTKFLDKTRFSAIGFNSQNILKRTFSGLGIGAFAILAGTCILYFTNKIIITGISFDIKKLSATILIFLFVAFAEEMVFRGYILRNLLVSFNKFIALAVSALLFAAIHSFNPGINLLPIISLFFAGLLYGATFIYNKSLWFPIAAHFSWNLFQSMLGFNVSGNVHHSLLEMQLNGKRIFTGGDFGFEGSVYSVIIQGLIVIGLIIYFERKKQT